MLHTLNTSSVPEELSIPASSRTLTADSARPRPDYCRIQFKVWIPIDENVTAVVQGFPLSNYLLVSQVECRSLKAMYCQDTVAEPLEDNVLRNITTQFNK